jgi:hypothetical protein
MRSIPVNVEAFAGFVCVALPEPRVANQQTGEVRKDRTSGEVLYSVGVCAIRGRDSSVIQVSVAGEPRGLSVGAPVRLVDLEASSWDIDGRSGVAWRAASVVPATGAAPQGPTDGTARRPGSTNPYGSASPKSGDAA